MEKEYGFWYSRNYQAQGVSKSLRTSKLEENYGRGKRNKEILHEDPPRPDENLGLLNKLFNSLAFQQLFQTVRKNSDVSYLCSYALGVNDTQIF